MQCLREHELGVVLRVRVTPNAARTVAEGLRGERLALRIKAPPVDGKANAEVLRWAAEIFALRKSQVVLLRGEKSREKDLLLTAPALPGHASATPGFYEAIRRAVEALGPAERS